MLAATGARLVVLTNQSGVARRLVTREAMEAVHQRLREQLRQDGVKLAGVYACTHGPEAGCGCRKPAPGLARQAAQELGLDLADALVVGDRAADLGLAVALGVPSVLVLTGAGARTLAAGQPQPDYVVDDLVGVARLWGADGGTVGHAGSPRR